MHGKDGRVREHFRHRTPPEPLAARRSRIDEDREMHGCFAQAREFERGVGRATRVWIRRLGLGVGAFVIVDDRGPTCGVAHGYETARLTVSDRGCVCGQCDELFEGAARKRTRGKPAYVTGPREKPFEIFAERTIERRRRGDIRRHKSPVLRRANASLPCGDAVHFVGTAIHDARRMVGEDSSGVSEAQASSDARKERNADRASKKPTTSTSWGPPCCGSACYISSAAKS